MKLSSREGGVQIIAPNELSYLKQTYIVYINQWVPIFFKEGEVRESIF